MPSDPARQLSLSEAADLLGVHYMTIYRRVRLGILPARKIGGSWWSIPPISSERRQRPTVAVAAAGTAIRE